MHDLSSPDKREGASLVALPEHVRSPWWELGRRILAAFGILAGTVLLVMIDREGYRDAGDAILIELAIREEATEGARRWALELQEV